MGKVDLHLHSSVSDGAYTPEQVVEKAVGLDLTAIALTDHDNVDGITPALAAASRYPALTFIPGIEISTDIEDGEVHMLGYFVDHTDPDFLATLESMRLSRLDRGRRMVEKLKDLGVSVEWDRVREIAGDGSVGRPHIAQAILEKGYIETVRQAFSRYLSFDGPAYVHREKLTPEESIELIRKANGIPVLAHPLTNGTKDPEALIAGLAKAGLAGVEAWYKKYTLDDRSYLATIAARYGLITTGGSDFHGLDETYEVMIGEADVPPQVVDSLLALAAKRQ